MQGPEIITFQSGSVSQVTQSCATLCDPRLYHHQAPLPMEFST